MDGRNEPATAEQRKTIARLCMVLKIKEPIEEGIMTKGEAGSLIRKMVAEVEVRRRLGR